MLMLIRLKEIVNYSSYTIINYSAKLYFKAHFNKWKNCADSSVSLSLFLSYSYSLPIQLSIFFWKYLFQYGPVGALYVSICVCVCVWNISKIYGTHLQFVVN